MTRNLRVLFDLEGIFGARFPPAALRAQFFDHVEVEISVFLSAHRTVLLATGVSPLALLKRLTFEKATFSSGNFDHFFTRER